MPQANHVLGVAALSPDPDGARPFPTWGRDASEGWGTQAPHTPVTPMTVPGGHGSIVPMLTMPSPPASGAVTTYFIWDGDNVLVETDGGDPTWIN